MPHTHSMTIFGVDRISIKFVPELNNYSIALIEGDENETTVISIWRTSNGGAPPELNVEGVDFSATDHGRTNDALVEHDAESD
jgi:hypothetical protein